MTTEERLENLERELARTKRRNRWLLVVVGLVVVGLILAWTLTETTPAAQAQVVASEGEGCAETLITQSADGKTLYLWTLDRTSRGTPRRPFFEAEVHAGNPDR
jgi:uncharacterized protein involved in exopolysaccharide biosynthesis